MIMEKLESDNLDLIQTLSSHKSASNHYVFIIIQSEKSTEGGRYLVYRAIQ